MSRYTRLLNIVIEHNYHLDFGAIPNAALDASTGALLTSQYSALQFFSIVPDPQTVNVLSGHRMIFKTAASGFIVAIEIDPAAVGNQPLIPLDDNIQLRFGLIVKDKHFLNYSALPTLYDGLFRFSNNSANTAPGNFLTRAVPDYSSNRSYEAGELYLHTSAPNDGLFQAIRSTGPAPAPIAADWQLIPTDTYNSSNNYAIGAIVLANNTLFQALVNNPAADLNDITQWQELEQLPNQYVTRDDYLPLQSSPMIFDISAAGVNQATVAIYHLDQTEVIWTQQFIDNSAPLDDIVLQLEHLPVGAYHIEVSDSSNSVLSALNYDFYLHSSAQNQGWFGVIEISLGSGNFALIDGVGQITNPDYFIRFLNRSSRWRYIFPAAQTLGVGAELVQEDSLGQVLVTNNPRPLTRYGAGIALQTDMAATPSVSEEVLLPEPKTNRIRYQNNQWFSEIHLSNLPL